MNFSDISRSIGRDVSLSDEPNWQSGPYKAFVQPLRYKNKMYLDGAFTEIGRNTAGYYLYIGPPEHDVTALTSAGRLTDSEGKVYIINRCEKVWFGTQVFYIWAILREANEVHP